MTQWILIVILACLPPFINRRMVRKQMIEEAIQQRAKARREWIRQLHNQYFEEDE